MNALDAIFSRRSYGRLRAPGPSPAEVTTILLAAAAAPDHKNLRPWKFVILEGDAKDAFGAVLADAYRSRCEAAGKEVVPAKLDKERTKLGRAPLVVIVATVDRGEGVVPFSDRRGAGAAAAQNMLLATTALGYGSIWRTGDPATDENVKAAIGVTADDEITGFLYIGTVIEGNQKPPNEPNIDDLVAHYPFL